MKTLQSGYEEEVFHIYSIYIEAVGVNGSASCSLKIPFLSQVRCRFESGTVSPFYYNDFIKNEKCFVLVVFYNFQFKNVSYLG